MKRTITERVDIDRWKTLKQENQEFYSSKGYAKHGYDTSENIPLIL